MIACVAAWVCPKHMHAMLRLPRALAVNTTYGPCMSMVNCRVPVRPVGGSFLPASATPAIETWDRLFDGQSSTPGTTNTNIGWGVRTSAGVSNPAITLALDGPYSDIGGVSIWPLSDSLANVALGQNLTIWLHTLPNITADTAKVACAVRVRTITSFETYIQCPAPGVAGVRYSEHACMPS